MLNCDAVKPLALLLTIKPFVPAQMFMCINSIESNPFNFALFSKDMYCCSSSLFMFLMNEVGTHGQAFSQKNNVEGF